MARTHREGRRIGEFLVKGRTEFGPDQENVRLLLGHDLLKTVVKFGAFAIGIVGGHSNEVDDLIGFLIAKAHQVVAIAGVSICMPDLFKIIQKRPLPPSQTADVIVAFAKALNEGRHFQRTQGNLNAYTGCFIFEDLG